VVEPISVLIPFDSSHPAVAVETARRLARGVSQVVLAGEAPPEMDTSGVEMAVGLNGTALQSGVERLREPITVVLEPGANPSVEELRVLCGPIRSDEADVVVAAIAERSEDALSALARRVAGLKVRDPLSPIRAVRTDALRPLHLVSQGTAVTAELVVKLAAQCFRFSEVVIRAEFPRRSLASLAAIASTLLRYGLFKNDTDNTHEGYNTLLQIDQAPRYNAWLGRKLRPHLGRRVLEVGAGIGTITREIAQDRELVIALEADAFYVQRLQNVFRDSPVVRPLHAPVETTDWAALARENLDTVMLSNVLEHIQDDATAVRKFRSVLPPGGRLVILVPALMALYGSIDVAIGHFRRYDSSTLRQVIEANGFRLEVLEWLNLLGIPGWFFNSRVLKRRSVPGFQVRLYDQLAPLLAQAESAFRLPIGMSLLAVARAAP
jgi:2-polyprenyl-3-methyl-5-hydroxy-6-metoxy-1,4-benzoquinol methylase